MADLILKEHGAVANGTISVEPDGRWRASFLVRDFDRDTQHEMGPKFLESKDAARAWVISQAAHHGFGQNDFDIDVE